MTMELKKDPNRRRKGPKPIKETKASKPENRFSMKDIKVNKEDNKDTQENKNTSEEQDVRPNTTEETVSTNEDNSTQKKGKRRRGRPKGNKVTGMVRVSTETISQLNTLKMVLGLYSQDDVVAKGLDYLVGNLNGPDRRYYNILLEVEKRRNNK